MAGETLSIDATPVPDDPAQLSPSRVHDNQGPTLRDNLIVLLVAGLVFLGCMVSPPSLMDDVDAVQGQIARNMLDSGDWVTARLNGVKYLEKAPLKYWLMAASFEVFGVHDWASRIPVAGSAVLLCWLVFRIGCWAGSRRMGLYSGLALATSLGLFLFTRVQIPDAILTTTITLAMWAFLRALDPAEPRPGRWSTVMAAAIGTGLLIKGMIAAVFPVAAAVLYLLISGDWKLRETWRRLHVIRGIGVALLIAAPWHIAATIQNPPYLDFTMESGPGNWRGFFWFYFFNEHILRFLNLRYPRDYNTVNRVWFWAAHLVWLFPWSVYLPAIVKLPFARRSIDRAGKLRLLCLCWTGFLLTFFTFSSTQEYYSMPCYPALALLIGGVLVEPDAAVWMRRGQVVLGTITALATAAIVFILLQVVNLPTPGDISQALVPAADASVYTLSLGHMGDLTMASFAYLKLPLMLAGLAFLIGTLASWFGPSRRWRIAGAVVMMVLFVHAARIALVAFDPYLGSRPLAEALNRAPHGKVILDNQYYTFSSVVFYAEKYHGELVLLLNGRVNNLEYGSNSPEAPVEVFIDDARFQRLWNSGQLYYICVEGPSVAHLEELVGADALHQVVEAGGKFVYANRRIGTATP